MLFHVLHLLHTVCFFTLHKSFLETVVQPSHTEASTLCKTLRTIRTRFMELVRVFWPVFLFCFYFTNKLTNTVVQSPYSEANLSSASQKIPRILWNLKVHYRIHKTPPIVPTLSQINPFYSHPSHLLHSNSNIIFASMRRSSKLSLCIVSPHQTTVCTFPVSLTCHMTHPFHSLCNTHVNFILRICIYMTGSAYSSSL